MHPVVFGEFERICTRLGIGGSVLEIGAVPAASSLLCLPALAGAREKIGINLDGPHRYRDFTIERGNANAMPGFADARFDAVLCNSVLEHDRRFWLTLAEIRRVTRPGGWIVIGTPGFRRGWSDRAQEWLGRLPLLGRMAGMPRLGALLTATLTLQVHDAPADYWRFSPQAFAEVFLEHLDEVEVRTLMQPPRIIGVGRKPAAAAVGGAP